MKKHFSSKLHSLAIGVLLGVAGCFAAGCSEEIDQSNRYTFTGETITDYLENRPEQFSKFCQILEKAKIGTAESAGSFLNTLSTYGTYTCFIPTNEAVQKFMEEQYQLGQDLLAAGEKNTTGIESPEVEDLTVAKATEIAKNHLMEKSYKTADLDDGSLPTGTFSNKLLTLKTESDEVTGQTYRMITATGKNWIKITEADAEVENGIIHTIGEVLVPSDNTVDDLIKDVEQFSIFWEALYKTGLYNAVKDFEIDPGYDPNNYEKQSLGTDTQKARQFSAPSEKKQRYTILVEPDYVFNENGIYSFEDLVAFADVWYGSKYYDEVDNSSYESPNNPLYRFVAYHILDRGLDYTGASGGTGCFIMRRNTFRSTFNSETMFPETFDRTEYFETMLPYTSIKVTLPTNGKKLVDGLIANYSQEMGTTVKNVEMTNYINVPIKESEDFEFTKKGKNGSIHTLGKILVYNEDEMAGNVLNERMRWDGSALFPELTNNLVRWATSFTDDLHGLTIPNDYIKRIKIRNEDTVLFYLRPNTAVGNVNWISYQGDEFLADGTYDYDVRLPYVPEGTYEVRLGFSASTGRGICQMYFDGKVCGIPVDMMTFYTDQTLQLDEVKNSAEETEPTEEEKNEHDKNLRNRGWMRAPASAMVKNEDSGPEYVSMRQSTMAFRRIITTTDIVHGKDYWVRFKDVTSTATGDRFSQHMLDYIELVPKSVYSDPSKAEDRY